jgi:hypothetical protein
MQPVYSSRNPAASPTASPGRFNRLTGLREVRAGILDAEIGVLADQVAEYRHVPLAVHDQ